MRILEKISRLITVIAFQHENMYKNILDLNMIHFIMKISEPAFTSEIRSNAVFAISLLTYNEKLFDEIIKQRVIDKVLQLCNNPL